MHVFKIPITQPVFYVGLQKFRTSAPDTTESLYFIGEKLVIYLLLCGSWPPKTPVGTVITIKHRTKVQITLEKKQKFL